MINIDGIQINIDERDKMDNEEIFLRQFIAHYMSYRAAALWNDGYMINLQYGYMNNMKRVLVSRFGRSEKELRDVIAQIEDVTIETIKKRPAFRPAVPVTELMNQ